MKKMTKIILSKTANALIPHVSLKAGLKFLLAYGTLGAGNIILEKMRNTYGGLWVGGILELYDDRLLFKPNMVNRLMQEGEMTLNIPLAAITKVIHRFGWITGIVDVMCGDALFSFRCFGSKNLIRTIKVAILSLEN